MEKIYYRRKLPHWHPPGVPVFLTWRLFGSLPASAIDSLIQKQQLLHRELSTIDSTDDDSRLRKYKRLFAMIDTTLDNAKYGPLWLKDPIMASMIQDILMLRCGHLYKLWAYVVMANHVHVFLQPKLIDDPKTGPTCINVSLITKRLKGFTSREANRHLDRVNQPFWQDESFDHWSRNEAEFHRIVTYIENNPVKAGLIEKPEDWRWSSAAERRRRGLTEFGSLT
jgi:REP element-mobilizing transposase RayT